MTDPLENVSSTILPPLYRRYGISVLAPLACAAFANVRAAGVDDPAHSAQADVRVIKHEARPWDAAVQKRVVEDMADGKPSAALQLPVLLKHSVPKYPKEARKAGIQGIVSVEVKIGLNGKVAHFATVSGNPELVEAVKTAVSQWRYKPVKIDGTPYDLRAFVDVAFTIRP